MVDQGLLWIALYWAAAALHQAERTYASLEPYFEYRNERFGKGVTGVTPEMQRPTAILWANVQYLMIGSRIWTRRWANSYGVFARRVVPGRVAADVGDLAEDGARDDRGGSVGAAQLAAGRPDHLQGVRTPTPLLSVNSPEDYRWEAPKAESLEHCRTAPGRAFPAVARTPTGVEVT